MRKILILGLIVLVVFLAGCARKGEVPTGTGVIIKSFGPDISTVDSNTPVNFILSIKNTGGVKAENVHAVLFGLSDKWSTVPALNDLAPELASGLAAADPTTGLPGEEITKTWEEDKAPASSSDISYDANVRVQYKYKTEATGLVRVVSADYLRTNPNVQRGIISSQTTAGPLSVNFFARSPVVTGENNVVRVQIEVQNVGEGKTFSGDNSVAPASSVTAGTLNKIRITEVDGCTRVTSSSTKAVLLIGGKSATINCEKDITTTTTFTDFTFTVKIEYGYFVDAATQVTVLKKLT